MYSPNHLLPSNQSYILVELLQKQAAAAKRRGVVGKIGSTIPTMPKTRQIMPAMNHNALAALSSFPSVVLQACPFSVAQHPCIFPSSLP